MNILLISYDYLPNRGGIANISFQIADQLNKLSNRTIVIAQKTRGDKEFDKHNKFLTYRCIDIFCLRELILIFFLPYLVLRYKIGIIYLLYWCQGGIATFLTSKILNIPYVFHAYGGEFVDYKKTLLDKIKYSLLRQNYKGLIFRNAKRVISISNYTKNILIKSGVRDYNIDVVYHGVDINRFKPNLDTSKIILRHNLVNKKILLTVSRLKKYKGHDTVINLMPQLLKRTPNLVYIIVGSGPDKEFLKSLVKKHNLQNNVIFAGWAVELLPLYYNACDIYIMLTKEWLDKAEFEGFGLVFLEANSCCKPVIGARTGGITDAIIDGKTGYLVDPNNSQEILDKIILLLENRELAKKLGEEGRQRIIKEGLTWESMGDKIRTILASVIKSR